jgi:[protein-PII] uridylyltransferase
LNQANIGIDVAAQGRRDLEASAAWQETERNFQSTGRAADVQRALTQAVEQAAIEAFQAALAPVFPKPVVMLAAGAFARVELFPYSNADIVIVRQGDPPRDLNEAVAEFVRLLWARGVRPNQRVCSLAECLAPLEQNADLHLKLVDRRTLAGDPAFAEQFEREFRVLLSERRQQMVERSVTQARARHEKYGNTPSHREPDVEESPGGLRDAVLIANLEKLCPERIESTAPLSEAVQFLSFVRCFLHYRARENRNVLDLAAQQAIAGQFAGGREAGLWMRDYFMHARAVYHETRRALDACDARTAAGNRAPLVEGAAADPEALFRLLELTARDGISPAPETERPLMDAHDALAAFCERERPLWSTIGTILTLPHAPLALRVLQRTDLLPAIFPEWAAIEGVAAGDSDHAYTIDEHTLLAIERISDLREIADPARQRFGQLFSEIEDPALLLFALLFHKIPGSTGGSEAAARIQMPASDRELVRFLIDRQTSMADVASGRNLDDPATIHRLTELVGTVERLRLLALVAYAGIAATSSEAMIPWRLDQLWRTYGAAHRALTRELETDRIQELPAALPETAEFIKGFPTRYLRAHTAEEIAAHTRLYQRSRPSGVAVELDAIEGAYELRVVAQDRPALFASFAGAISSFGLNIVRAEAFANSQGAILDTFTFTDPKRTLQLNPPEADRLQDLMGRIALGKTDARRLFRNRPLPRPEALAIAPQIEFDADAHETATLIEIVAEDRLGLLYSLANVFSSNACDIDTVLIDTKGHRAIDVFYVSQDGKKLSPEMQETLKRQLHAACLGTETGS